MSDPRDFVTLSLPPGTPTPPKKTPKHIIREELIPAMAVDDLRSARAALARLLGVVDARLSAVAASDQAPAPARPSAGPQNVSERALSDRLAEVRAALNGEPEDDDVARRAAAVRRQMEGR